MGRIAMDNGDDEQAKAYYERAMVVSGVLGDEKRVNRIKLTLERM